MANLNGHRWPSLGRQADARAAYVQTVCYLPDKRRTANRTVCCVPLRSTLQSDPFVVCPIEWARQSFGHTAKYKFPVVKWRGSCASYISFSLRVDDK